MRYAEIARQYNRLPNAVVVLNTYSGMLSLTDSYSDDDQQQVKLFDKSNAKRINVLDINAAILQALSD